MPVPVEQDDTQTDSESPENGEKYTHTGITDDPADHSIRNDGARFSPLLNENNANEIVAAACSFLEKLTDSEANDRDIHDSITEAVNYITTFIESLLSRSLVSDSHWVVISTLLGDSFITRLFDLRAIFRGIAAMELPPNSRNFTVTCWADELLVKICACILHLATCGMMQDLNKVIGVQSLKTMQESEARRASTQLPIRFEGLVNALTSKYSSPAMSRMALTLLYGAHVLRRQYKDSCEVFTRNDKLMSGLSACIIRYGVNSSGDFPDATYPSTLAEYAMAVSLYISSIGSISPQTETPFAPHTEHAIVDLINLILDHIPSEPSLLDPWLGPPAMLVNDLKLLNWVWKRWGDGSTSIAATALKLTRYWIQYYEPRKDGLSYVDVLLAAAPHSFQTLLHLIDAPSAETPTIPHSLSLSETTIVKRLCEAYSALASAREPDDLRYERVLAEACKRLSLYILTPSQDGLNDTIWELVIRTLVSAGPSVIRAAHGDARQVQFRWNSKGLVEQVLQIIMAIIGQCEEALDMQTTDWIPTRTLRLKCLLDFLVVLMHANSCPASAVISSATFLPTLVSWISKPLDNRLGLEINLWNALRASALMLVGLTCSHFKICCSALTNRFPEFDLDGFIDVILDDEGNYLLEICALACYVVATEDDRILDDPVVILTIWSRLRDTLLATLQRRFVNEDEAISVATSGTICASLVSILSATGKQTRGMVLASPWTQTLRTELGKVLDSHRSRDEVGLGLYRQLKEVGKIILHVIDDGTKPTSVDGSLRLVCADGGGWLRVVPMLLF